MSRSRISSILEWFRTDASTDEIRMVMPLVLEAVQKRTAAPAPPAKAKAAKQRGAAERSAAASRAWETRRLNAANKAAQSSDQQEVTQ